MSISWSADDHIIDDTDGYDGYDDQDDYDDVDHDVPVNLLVS